MHTPSAAQKPLAVRNPRGLNVLSVRCSQRQIKEVQKIQPVS